MSEARGQARGARGEPPNPGISLDCVTRAWAAQLVGIWARTAGHGTGDQASPTSARALVRRTRSQTATYPPDPSDASVGAEVWSRGEYHVLGGPGQYDPGMPGNMRRNPANAFSHRSSVLGTDSASPICNRSSAAHRRRNQSLSEYPCWPSVSR